MTFDRNDVIIDWFDCWQRWFQPLFDTRTKLIADLHYDALRHAITGTEAGGWENDHTLQYYLWAMSSDVDGTSPGHGEQSRALASLGEVVADESKRWSDWLATL